MALSAPQLAKLVSTQQRAACRIVAFPTWYVQGIRDVSLGSISWTDMVNIYPRHSWVANSASIVLDGNDSLTHAHAAASGHSWTLTAGSGSLTDNSDGTATYTAPASGTGRATIRLRTTGNSQDNIAYVAYGDSSLNVGEVTGFHADIQTGGWEMTVNVYGDCAGFDRNAGILLVINDYWNGSEDTFGGYKWADGVFYGYVMDPRHAHEDHMTGVMTYTIASPEATLRLATVDEIIFSKTDTGEELVDASFVVMDAIWWILQDDFNHRHNVWIFDDDNSPDNLKLSFGPIWEVCEDVAKRSFCVLYSSRQGDVYVVPDPDVRWAEYSGGTTGPPKATNELTFTTALFEAIDIDKWLIPTWGEGGIDQDDIQVQQVILTGIQDDLSEIWARYPSDANRPIGGKVEQVSGLICSAAGDLETWAGRLWYKLNGTYQADLALFLFHHLDLFEPISLTYTPDATKIYNTGIALDDIDFYVSGIDYTIEPGLGRWRGSMHIVSRAEQSPEDKGENSSD